MLDYHDIKELARASGCKTTDLIVLAVANDPFYSSVPFRQRGAEWFADLWQRLGFGPGTHLRRAHYAIISQPEPIIRPDGKPYENTQTNWTFLCQASLSARYLGLIPADDLIDRRNPSPRIHQSYWGPKSDSPPGVYIGCARPSDHEIPNGMPHLPAMFDSGFYNEQDYLVEVWVEKSTMNDVLVPLATKLNFNLVPGIGEMSETACRKLLERAASAHRPVRVLYISDFDPAGYCMPVSVARKLEFHIRNADLDLDITLDPIALRPEQCQHYRLPRTPIKDTEKRATRFEERFGSGATELDALEAIHPGELARIVEDQVRQYVAFFRTIPMTSTGSKKSLTNCATASANGTSTHKIHGSASPMTLKLPSRTSPTSKSRSPRSQETRTASGCLIPSATTSASSTLIAGGRAGKRMSHDPPLPIHQMPISATIFQANGATV